MNALRLRWAEHETPVEIGQLAPCLGSLITTALTANCVPPNCAPYPVSFAICKTRFSISLSRKPVSFGSYVMLSYAPHVASLSVRIFCSGLRPPATTAIVYGGQADVPICVIWSRRSASKDLGLRSAFVPCMNDVLFDDPPPFAQKIKRMHGESSDMPKSGTGAHAQRPEKTETCAGMLLRGSFSSKKETGLFVEKRRARDLYTEAAPELSAAHESFVPGVRKPLSCQPKMFAIPVS